MEFSVETIIASGDTVVEEINVKELELLNEESDSILAGAKFCDGLVEFVRKEGNVSIYRGLRYGCFRIVFTNCISKVVSQMNVYTGKGAMHRIRGCHGINCRCL